MRYKFTFTNGTPRSVISGYLSSVEKITKYLYSESRVRIDARYWVSANKPECEVDASTEVGQTMVQILAGMLIDELGEEGFAIESEEA